MTVNGDGSHGTKSSPRMIPMTERYCDILLIHPWASMTVTCTPHNMSFCGIPDSEEGLNLNQYGYPLMLPGQFNEIPQLDFQWHKSKAFLTSNVVK
jgi:hypothetical protein